MVSYKVSLTQFRLLYKAYNNNENSLFISNRLQVNEAYKLAESLPELFIMNRLDAGEYSFHIKSLGLVLPILKYNSKHEKDV